MNALKQHANIKTCNFQQLEGFTGFDFAEVSQIKDGDRMRPDLNATNFTGCIMNYANFQYANIIGTVFQASNITRANFKNTKFLSVFCHISIVVAMNVVFTY